MAGSIYSLISKERLSGILENFHAYTGLCVRLIDADGTLLMNFGDAITYCEILKQHIFGGSACVRKYADAGRRAMTLGEAYIFTCHGNLSNIAFPLMNQGQLLGTVIIGPFLITEPDSTLIGDLAERYSLTAGTALELYDEIGKFTVYSPTQVNHLKKLVDDLLSPLMPSELALLLQSREKMAQQAKINETIQTYKEQKPDKSLTFFYRKEKELLAKVRSGTVRQVKALLNELMGYVLFSEGNNMWSVRIRCIELTVLLSRVAIDGGARTDSIFQLSNQFVGRIYQEETLEDICMVMQEVLDGFMEAMFNEKDKGNLYIRKALRFMADNYSKHLEMSDVAEHVGLSPSYFSSLFHQVVGVSFREQLCRIRVEESKCLLLIKKYSLADIAISMGFPDQSYYCKVFKRIVGVSPGKYRG